jgi:hypothetical protein
MRHQEHLEVCQRLLPCQSNVAALTASSTWRLTRYVP